MSSKARSSKVANPGFWVFPKSSDKISQSSQYPDLNPFKDVSGFCPQPGFHGRVPPGRRKGKMVDKFSS